MTFIIIFIAALAGILPMLAYLIFIYWLDRYEREPWWMVGLVFIWGGLGGAMFGCIINTTVISAVGMIFGPETAEWVGPVVVAPLVEEVTKIIPLFGLIFLRHFDNATDGLIYGAACGLGFAMTENFYYFYNVGTSAGLAAMGVNILVRTAFTALVHCAASASWGFFLGLGRYRHPAIRWLIVPPLGYAVAVGIHAFWNGSATLSQSEESLGIQAGACAVIIALAFLMFILTQASLLMEHRVIKAGLAEEAAEGLIPEAHVRVIPYWLKRIQRGWLEQGIDRERYVKAATLLAFRKNQAKHASGQTRQGLLDDVAKYREEIRLLLGSAQVRQSAPGSASTPGGWGSGWGS